MQLPSYSNVCSRYAVTVEFHQGCEFHQPDVATFNNVLRVLAIFSSLDKLGQPRSKIGDVMHLDQDRGEQNIRVLVVDNTRIHAQLLADALKRDASLEVVGAVSHSGDLIDLIHSQKVDVAVIGCNLDEQPLHGIEVLRQVKSTWGGIRAIILLDSSKRDVVIEAFRAGARGLFTRHESLEMLSKCVRRVHEGQIWANTEQMGFAIEALAAAP